MNNVFKPYKLQIRYLLSHLFGNVEQELIYVCRNFTTLRPDAQFSTAVDIGANVGLYTYLFSTIFDSVHSFEPNDCLTYRIDDSNISNVSLYHVALSNIEKVDGDLYFPVHGSIDYGLASLQEPINNTCSNKSIKVTQKTLDSYNLNSVELIKIDIEGHEQQCIEGSVVTILKYKPILVVEIEQRHLDSDIQNVFNYIEDLGYQGYFLEGNFLVSLSYFITNVHQNLEYLHTKRYKNNFIFIPSSI